MAAPKNFRTPSDKKIFNQNVLLNPARFSVVTQDDNIFKAANIRWKMGKRNADNDNEEDQSDGYKTPIIFGEYLDYFLSDLVREGVEINKKHFEEIYKEKVMNEESSTPHERIAAKYVQLAKTVPNSDVATKYTKQAVKIRALAQTLKTIDDEEKDKALETDTFKKELKTGETAVAAKPGDKPADKPAEKKEAK